MTLDLTDNDLTPDSDEFEAATVRLDALVAESENLNQYDIFWFARESFLSNIRQERYLLRTLKGLTEMADSIQTACASAQAEITTAQTQLTTDVATVGTYVAANLPSADDLSAIAGLGTSAAAAITGADSALQAAVPGAFPPVPAVEPPAA